MGELFIVPKALTKLLPGILSSKNESHADFYNRADGYTGPI